MSEPLQAERSVRLDSLAEIDPEALRVSTSPRHKFKYVDISCASNGKLTLPSDFIEFADAPSRARKILRNGDLIVSTVRPNLKAFAYCRLADGPYIASTGFAVLRARENVDAYFLLSALLSDDLSKQIESHAVGSNYPAINSADIRRLRIPAFDSKTQSAIGKVLATIDTAIEQTEALIEKYQHIKAGLMHDLFTRGVLPTGQLRPPREQAPELYQATAIGWIPREWSLHRLNVVADVIDPNPSHRNPIYHPAGFPFISTVEFIENDEVEIDTSRRVIEEIVEEQERRCNFSPKSIGFSRKGTIGEIRFLPTGIRFALLDSLCVINPRVINASYLFHSLRSECLTRQSKNMTMGQALPQVSIGRVRDLLVPLPDADEQTRIEDRLDAVVLAIKGQSEQKSKLRRQKLGLMQDLLTGKVRVTVDASPSEAVT